VVTLKLYKGSRGQRCDLFVLKVGHDVAFNDAAVVRKNKTTSPSHNLTIYEHTVLFRCPTPDLLLNSSVFCCFALP